MTFGEQIKQARERKRISQEELAERLGVSRQAVSKWENESSVPQGANKALLAQVLELDLGQENAVSSPKNYLALFGGWILAAVLLMTIVVICVQKQTAAEVRPEEPGFQSVRFYDSEMNEVLSEALWYDAAKIECILIEWTGGSAENVKMFSTPTGTQTVDETKLLLTKGIPDGSSVVLLSARTLKNIFQSHVFFTLNCEGNTITSDVYNIFDHSSLDN